MMSNPAFLIDGHSEQLIVSRLCPGCKINKINCNGNSVKLDQMARRICSHIKLLNNRHYPIVILIDREEREETVEEIIEILSKEIKSIHTSEDIRIGVCDRMIENWILSDWDGFVTNAKLTEVEKPSEIEGKKGKSLMRKEYKGYQETTDGVTFFLESNHKIIYNESPSFKAFINVISDLPCDFVSEILS